jgi:hypothetical protein
VLFPPQAPCGNIYNNPLSGKHFSYREKTYSYAGSTKKMFQDVIIRNDFVTRQNDLTVKA